jgi:hypothetical protein
MSFDRLVAKLATRTSKGLTMSQGASRVCSQADAMGQIADLARARGGESTPECINWCVRRPLSLQGDYHEDERLELGEYATAWRRVDHSVPVMRLLAELYLVIWLGAPVDVRGRHPMPSWVEGVAPSEHLA